jgi:hypothetical protein
MSKAKSVKGKGRAKGEPARTARVRYVEPATKKDGNPFFALRVESGLLRAFKSLAKQRKMLATTMARQLMANECGYELPDNEGE